MNDFLSKKPLICDGVEEKNGG